ncbi:MAG TPA: sigma-70 family RNA polymerase sigma factor [Chthoniobacterales bacterium]|jgi:RNA polymerase sigma-70 factor (ECF subfamily)
MDHSTTPFDALVRRFERPLFKYAAQILDDPDRARDVVQEVFIELERRLNEPRADVTAKWLFAVCRNRALNVCRKERRLAFVGDEFLEATAGNYEAPFQQLQHEEAANFLMRIIATLPPRQQELLRLRFQNDLSYHDISEITKLSINNVGVLIHTAIKTLRRRYAPVANNFFPVAAARKNQ